MVTKNNVKRTAFVDNVCCVCGSPYASPSYLIKHMMQVHNLQLHPRPQSKSRPPSIKYDFVKAKSEPHQHLLYGCPSCWFYTTQDLERLKEHIQSTHLVDLDTPVHKEEEVVYQHRNPSAEKEIFEKITEITNNFKKLFS